MLLVLTVKFFKLKDLIICFKMRVIFLPTLDFVLFVNNVAKKVNIRCAIASDRKFIRKLIDYFELRNAKNRLLNIEWLTTHSLSLYVSLSNVNYTHWSILLHFACLCAVITSCFLLLADLIAHYLCLNGLFSPLWICYFVASSNSTLDRLR